MSSSPSSAIDALRVLHEPGEWVEIRAIGAGKTRSVLFTLDGDLESVRARIDSWDQSGLNIYHTLNPLTPPPDQKGYVRGPNKRSLAASDTDVLSIRWIPLDFDPFRRNAAGEELSSTTTNATASEKAAALELAKKALAFFRERGYSPIVVDSGNGYQALVPAELSKEASSKVRDLLTLFAEKWDTVAAHVDTSVYNPSRVLALPGTLKRKGDNSPERPWREVKLLDGNRSIVVTAAVLDELLQEFGAATGANHTSSDKKSGFYASAGNTPKRLAAFLDHSEIPHHAAEPFNGSTKIVLETANGETFCPNQAKHNSDSGPSTECVFITADGRFGFQCFHSECGEVQWRYFRAFHELHNELEGRGAFFAEKTFSDTQNPSSAGCELQLVRFSDISTESIQWLWPGYVALRKLVSLNGEPGEGKSLITLDFAARLTTGRDWPDGSKNTCPPSDVILLTEEEDHGDTVKPRFVAAGGDPKRLFTLKSNGAFVLKIEQHLEALETLVRTEAPGTKLLIFDPALDFVKARPNDDQEVRAALVRLRDWAARLGIAVILVNHLNKKTDLSAKHRVAGARGWTSVPRLNFIAGRASEGNLRHLCALKNNIVGELGSLDYQVSTAHIDISGEKTVQPVLVWVGRSDTTADDVANSKSAGKPSDIIDTWLEATLQPENKRHFRDEVMAKAKKANYSEDQIKRSATRIGVRHERTKTVPSRTVWWLDWVPTPKEMQQQNSAVV